MSQAQGILLEAGTNEMELLVFKLDNVRFGINVAKVREIIQRPKAVAIPHSPFAVEGSFRLRDDVLTLINLGAHFHMEGEQTRQGEGMSIIVEFNSMQCGILVDAVEVIHRLRWDDIEPPSPYLMNMNVPITGVARVGKDLVLIADFETIISEILGINGVDDAEGPAEEVPPEDAHILLADDSMILRKQLTRVLENAGYRHLCVCADGREAWEAIKRNQKSGEHPFDLVLTDIEMPQMDGLHLTAKIKGDPDLKDTPVILFSSLITDDNRRKGEAVGADEQICKPDSQNVVTAIQRFLGQTV